MERIRAYVALGSNLADPLAQVQRAFEELDALPDSACVARSPLYRSEAVGPPQPDYINAVAALDTGLDAWALLEALQAIERAHRRLRVIRWGPRTLDLDLLLFDELRQDEPRLVLPHPRMHERAFVLYPLFDIAPDLHIPGHGELATLLERCPPLAMERLQGENKHRE